MSLVLSIKNKIETHLICVEKKKKNSNHRKFNQKLISKVVHKSKDFNIQIKPYKQYLNKDYKTTSKEYLNIDYKTTSKQYLVKKKQTILRYKLYLHKETK